MRIPKTRHPFPFWQLTLFPKHVLILQREHNISDAAKFFKSLRRSFSVSQGRDYLQINQYKLKDQIFD